MAEERRPNILFAIADDWSYGHAGVYGCPWIETPSFDRIARDGVLFKRAYTPNAKCAPSRACILTGRNSWQLKAACNHVCAFPPEFKSYVEALQEDGYFAGYTGKGWGPGYAKDESGKTRQMTGKNFRGRTQRPPAGGISNNDYAANFGDFLAACPPDQPWCFWYGTTEPHRGYQFKVGETKAGKKRASIEHVPGFWPDNDVVRHDILDYAFEVEHYDRHLGRILDQLEKAGQLENTLVVATSDHGMPFPRCKGQAYDYSNHIPLAIMWPVGIKKPGRVVDDYVSFIDLAPTFLAVAGLDWQESGMRPTSGRALTDILYSQRAGQVVARRDHVLIGKERHDIGRPNDWGYPIRGIVSGDMLYIHNYQTDRWPSGNPETGYLNCDGSPTKTDILEGRADAKSKVFWDLCFGKRPSEELYNVADDPDCVKNLAGLPAYQEKLLTLKQKMENELRAQMDPRMEGKGEYFDKIPYVDRSTANFYERFHKGERVRAGWVNASDFEKEKLD